ncbi:uncharacterized protein [Macrobrachium rosenbergii]|uniref:uncharacterized protein n=1 Tax=Macrobrachium rosenbergii TaxID=79674 RepID=UPI0034D74CA3
MQSVFPPMKEDLKKKPDSTNILINANGTPIRIYGTTTWIISILGSRYHWPFLVANVKFPLLDADFLGHHGLLVDVGRERLLDTGTCLSRQLAKGPGMPAICSTASSSYKSLLQEFLDVFKPELRQLLGLQQSTAYSITFQLTVRCLSLQTNGPSQRWNGWAFAKASSLWASPLHVVKKADGLWRLCGDYCRLNVVTTPDHYPLPNMQDLTSALHGAKIFSKMDLLKSYFQVPVHPDDVPKTTIIMPFGVCTFFYSTFGLRNADATFQRLMDTILEDLPFCVCHVDDILIFSRLPKEHL